MILSCSSLGIKICLMMNINSFVFSTECCHQACAGQQSPSVPEWVCQMCVHWQPSTSPCPRASTSWSRPWSSSRPRTSPSTRLRCLRVRYHRRRRLPDYWTADWRSDESEDCDVLRDVPVLSSVHTPRVLRAYRTVCHPDP